MPITIYPGSMKKRNANGSYSDLVPAIATDPEVLDDFAEEYSTSETYNIGDYCIHNSDLYKCNTNNTTGTWNINAWDRVTVGDELVDHKNTLTKLIPILPGSTNNLGYTLNVGDYFEAGGVLYKVITAIPNTEAWADKASVLTDTVINNLSGIGFIGNSVLYTKSWFDTGVVNYTAAADGFAYGEICSYDSNNGIYAAIDGVRIGYNCSTGTITSFIAPIKRGQTITGGSAAADAKIEVKVYSMVGR